MLPTRTLILLALAASPLPAADLLFLTPEIHPTPAFQTLLRNRADSALKEGPWSVTGHRPNTLRLPPNEYYSEAPYYWPDPAHPGKMIRKDGQRNPDRFDGNHRDLAQMSNAVLALGAGAYYLNNPEYAKKAAEDIAVWFETPGTRMNPDLEHAQAVTGANDGRPTGIIDTVNLIHCAQGIAFLEASGKWDPARAAAAKRWFEEYLNWLRTSRNGNAEARSGNNHATWWTAQVATFAALTGNKAALAEAASWMRSDLLKQLEPNGAAPREEARTNSLSYSAYNLDAFATLCRIEERNGVDLWKEGNLPKAFAWIAPFIADPAAWKHQQITPYKGHPVFIGLAAPSFRDKLPAATDLWEALLGLI